MDIVIFFTAAVQFGTTVAGGTTVSSTVTIALLHKAAVELLVLETDEFDELSVDQKALVHSDGPRPGVCLGIIDRHVDLQRSEGRTPEPLGQPSGRGQRRAVHVEPAVVSEIR